MPTICCFASPVGLPDLRGMAGMDDVQQPVGSQIAGSSECHWYAAQLSRQLRPALPTADISALECICRTSARQPQSRPRRTCQCRRPPPSALRSTQVHADPIRWKFAIIVPHRSQHGPERVPGAGRFGRRRGGPARSTSPGQVSGRAPRPTSTSVPTSCGPCCRGIRWLRLPRRPRSALRLPCPAIAAVLASRRTASDLRHSVQSPAPPHADVENRADAGLALGAAGLEAAEIVRAQQRGGGPVHGRRHPAGRTDSASSIAGGRRRGPARRGSRSGSVCAGRGAWRGSRRALRPRSSTAMSCGRSAFRARWSTVGDKLVSTWKPTTWPRAWTPASVRPLASTRTAGR